MRETLLHFSEPLTAERRADLCRILAEHGAGCKTRFQSKKARFLFVAYDEKRTTMRQLLEVLTREGSAVRLVDV